MLPTLFSLTLIFGQAFADPPSLGSGWLRSPGGAVPAHPVHLTPCDLECSPVINFSFHPRPQRGTETLSPSALLSEGWGYIPGLLAIGGDAVL